MSDPTLQVGCQTFTWEMLGAGWTGGPTDLVRAIANGGYAGIEITDTMIGSYGKRAPEFADLLNGAGLSLVSFAFGSTSGFTTRNQIDADLETTKRWVDFAAHFPNALVSMGSATIVSEGIRDSMFEIAAEVYNRASEIGEAAGVTVAVHPSSHHGTLLLSRADYDGIFALLEPSVGWVPDTGHILRGGQDVVETMTVHSDRIRYVHLKDVDAEGNWAMLGNGVCDTALVIAAAQSARHFNGWLVLEEESDFAASDPATAVRINREKLQSMGI